MRWAGGGQKGVDRAGRVPNGQNPWLYCGRNVLG
jgi:hypothetical protein